MSANTKKAKLKAEQLYQACNCRAALEVHLQPFLDAKRFADHLSPDGPEPKEQNGAKKKSSVKRPFFDKGGFKTPPGSKLHRESIRTMINLARENARVFYPFGPEHGIYGKGFINESGNRPGQETLAQIAEDDFVILAHRAVLEGNGDFLRVIANVVEQDAKALSDTTSDPARYQVELVHKAALELVHEARMRFGESNEKPYTTIEGLPCFVPTKKQVRERSIEIFRRLEMPPPEKGRWSRTDPLKWSDSQWTKIWIASGLVYLREARGERQKQNANKG
jgi:hypothetical protein